MSNEKTAGRSGLLKCAIFGILFIAFYVIVKFVKSDVIKMGRYVVLFIVGVVLFRDVFAKGFKDIKEHPLKNLIWLLAGFIGQYIGQIIGSIPESIFYPDYMNTNTTHVMDAIKVMSPLIYIPIMGILGPIVEELFFRELLVDKLRGKLPGAILVILSGLLFTVYHMHGISLPEFLSCLPQGMGGVVFAIVVLYGKNFVTNCSIHILFNTCALALYAMM